MPNYIDKDGLSKVWSKTKSYIGGGYYSKSESDDRYISIYPQNGGVPIFHVDIPDYDDLNSIYGTEGTYTEVYLQNALKWCCKWATDNSHNGMITFTGQAIPSSQGWYVLNIYNVNDLTDGLPRYSSGILNRLNVVYEFGTYVFGFMCNEIYNANTIETKLNAKSDTGHNHAFLEGDGTITVVPQNHNEINFGGTAINGTIFFGYRATGDKPIPTTYVFGNNTNGSAAIKAGSVATSGNIIASGKIVGSTVYGAVFN